MANEIWKNALSSIESEWGIMLGGAYDTLNVISKGKGIDPDDARDFIEIMFRPDEILSDPEKRNIIISRLPKKDAEDLALILGISYNDTKQLFAGLKRIKYSSKVENVILNFFEIDSTPKIEYHPHIDEMVTDEMKYAMHDYQRQVVSDVQDLFLEDIKKCMIQMPTGSGKTRTAMYLITEMMNRDEPFMVLWLAYSKELCDQASNEFMKAWQSRGNRQTTVYNHYDTSKTLFPEKNVDGIVISTLAKLHSDIRKDEFLLSRISRNISLVVFDEAHEIVAKEYVLTMDSILNLGWQTKLLGLTATPGRTWNDPLEDEKLAKYFHGHKVSIRTRSSGESPMVMLTERGFLSKIEWEYLECESPSFSESDIKLIKNFRKEESELPENISRILSLDSHRNIKIINAVVKLLDSGKKRILIFATSVEHARLLSALMKLLKEHTCYAYCVDGKTDSAVRQNILDEFRKIDDIPKILCNYNVLTTGFDAPNIDAGIIARPTRSLVLFSQMVGRMIRGPKVENGTETATIISVIDLDLPGFKDAHDNWRDVW